MTRSTRIFGDRVLRSGKRFFSTRFKDEVKRVSVTLPVKVLDYETCKKMEIYGDQEHGNFKKVKFGELKILSLVNDNRSNRFGVVYSRKRKRNVESGLSLVCEKKVKTCLESSFVRKGPVVFGCTSSCSVYRFSCFVKLVLRYLTNATLFSWKRFSSFLLSDSTVSDYLSIGIRVLQDSTSTMSHGFFKVFGSVNSMPLFTVNFMSLPFCFLYIHSTYILKFAFLSYAFIMQQLDENVTNDALVKGSSVLTKKRRSAKKRIPRVSFFNNYFQKNGWAFVVTPVPGVREVSEYTEEKNVPFKLPEMYISSKSDEVTRIFEKSYPIYDMDSDDELWLKKVNSERFADNVFVLEETFEKIIDAFEKGNYCSPNDYSNAESAVNRCGGLASKEVLEAVYRYWMNKRKRKRSPLIRVFQLYQRKKVHSHSKPTVMRKKRSFKRRASQSFVETKLDFKKVMLNNQKILEEAAKASIKVHETQEAARKSGEAAIVKRQLAQQLMANADLAAYRATMALRIAAAARLVDQTTSATLGFPLK